MKISRTNNIWNDLKPILLAISVVAIPLLAIYFYPIITDEIRYHEAQKRCGKKPLSGFQSGFRNKYYANPGERAYRSPSYITGDKEYFCTVEEANNSGYGHYTSESRD